MLLDHGVWRAHADLGAGEDVDGASRVMRCERHLMRGGEDGDFVSLGYAAGPDEVWHDNARGAVFR